MSAPADVVFPHNANHVVDEEKGTEKLGITANIDNR